MDKQLQQLEYHALSLDSVLNALSTRRKIPHFERVSTAMRVMTKQAFTVNDLATLLAVCPRAYVLEPSAHAAAAAAGSVDAPVDRDQDQGFRMRINRDWPSPSPPSSSAPSPALPQTASPHPQPHCVAVETRSTAFRRALQDFDFSTLGPVKRSAHAMIMDLVGSHPKKAASETVAAGTRKRSRDGAGLGSEITKDSRHSGLRKGAESGDRDMLGSENSEKSDHSSEMRDIRGRVEDRGLLLAREAAAVQAQKQERRRRQLVSELPAFAAVLRSECLRSRKTVLDYAVLQCSLATELACGVETVREKVCLLLEAAPEFVALLPADQHVRVQLLRVNPHVPYQQVRDKLLALASSTSSSS